MTRAAVIRLVLIAALVGILELLCRLGVIDRFTMIPPSEMAIALVALIAHADWFWPDFTYTARNLIAASVLSIVLGFGFGLALHGVPRARRILEPIISSYYSVPTFVLYPLLIVVFGIGPLSLIVLGTMFAVVAMIASTLTALDRIPSVFIKAASASRLTTLQTIWFVRLPSAAPHLFTGLKLAVAYTIIGIIAGEFIISTAGLGRRIAFSYNDFDNRTMYGVMLLVLAIAATVNSLLQAWERRLHQRWFRAP